MANETVHRISSPGVWEATSVQSIIGIRKREAISAQRPQDASGLDTVNHGFSKPSTVLSDRFHAKRSLTWLDQSTKFKPALNEWEAWTLSFTGHFDAVPLNDELEDSDRSQLFISKPGPIVRLGTRSVAVGFGNLVKVIALGHERFEQHSGFDGRDLALDGLSTRKRKTTRKSL